MHENLTVGLRYLVYPIMYRNFVFDELSCRNLLPKEEDNLRRLLISGIPILIRSIRRICRTTIVTFDDFVYENEINDSHDELNDTLRRSKRIKVSTKLSDFDYFDDDEDCSSEEDCNETDCPK
ncbi:hypothetical protein SNEBB_008351 [Seison nebaliae]|nr:hypothetical protein SNEBB_008351 [Seison nebaliae]